MIIGECLYPNNLLRIPFNVHSETETVCVSIIPSETKSYDLNKVPTLNDIITGKNVNNIVRIYIDDLLTAKL